MNIWRFPESWRYPNSWMVYSGTSYWNWWWLGVSLETIIKTLLWRASREWGGWSPLENRKIEQIRKIKRVRPQHFTLGAFYFLRVPAHKLNWQRQHDGKDAQLWTLRDLDWLGYHGASELIWNWNIKVVVDLNWSNLIPQQECLLWQKSFEPFNAAQLLPCSVSSVQKRVKKGDLSGMSIK